MRIHKGLFVALASSAVAGSLLISSVAFADTAPAQGARPGWGRDHMMGRMPGVFGTVSAISGTTLSVDNKGFGQNATATTYTVDASSATVMKDGSSSSVSSIAVGDTVAVQGTVNGTSVVAKTIRDGVVPPGKGTQNPAPLNIQGTGQPVVGGSVTGVSGSSLTVATAQGNVVYTIDASSATVFKGGATSSVAGISTGDKVVVQGSVNGTSVAATSVIDQGTPPAPAASGRPTRGFFGAIRGFFQRLFGFF